MSRDLADHAIRLAEELGAPVFPVLVYPDPKKPGKTIKKPLITAWQAEGSSRNPDTIRATFAKSQCARATHVGVVMGDASGLLLVDIDGARGQEWMHEHMHLLPPTRQQRTQRDGGLHLYYRIRRGLGLKNSASGIAPGVDIRADGGFALDWSRDHAPQGRDIADAPAALIELLRRPVQVVQRVEPTVGGVVVEGARNDFLSRKAYGLRKDGASVEQIAPVLLAMNNELCSPPLPGAEVRKIAKGKRRVLPDEQVEVRAPDDDAVLPYTLAGDIGDEAQADEYVVRGLLDAQTTALLYGESATGKSCLTLHLALCIVSGRTFFGHEVKRGGVLYIAAEGGKGLRRRIQAARLAHDFPRDLPLAVVTASVRLTERDARRIIATARELEAKTGVRVVLVIFDTLARVMEGDENSTQDMSAAVRVVDQVREALTEASTLLVHHAGKDVTKGARGSSALRAAVDTELCVSGRRNPRTLSVEKQRDLDAILPVTFTLEAEKVGIDKNGAPTTAAVVREGRPVQREASRPKGPNPTRLFVELQRLQDGSDAVLTWSRLEAYTVAKALGIAKGSASLAAANLIRNGCLVEAEGGRYRLAGFEERPERSAAFSLNETEHGPRIVQPFRGSMTLNAERPPELNGSSNAKPKGRAASRNGQAGRKQGKRKGRARA